MNKKSGITSINGAVKHNIGEQIASWENIYFGKAARPWLNPSSGLGPAFGALGNESTRTEKSLVPDAWEHLNSLLEEGEKLEFIVLGDTAWSRGPIDATPFAGSVSQQNILIPLEVRHKLLDIGSAEPHMHGWKLESTSSSYGQEVYAFIAWSNKYVYKNILDKYNGSRISLVKAFREPTALQVKF